MNYTRLKETLIRHEGKRQFAYVDTVGKLTIGIGRNLTDKGVTADEMVHMMNTNIRESELELRNEFPWFEQLGDVRQEVILNMCYNMGMPKLLGFKKMIKALEEFDYHEASKQMIKSKWYRQVKTRGAELAKVMRDGKWE